jgi:hypothetical protein
VRIQDIPDMPLVGMINGTGFKAACARIKYVEKPANVGTPRIVLLEIFEKSNKNGNVCGYKGNCRRVQLTFPKGTVSKDWPMYGKKMPKRGDPAAGANANFTYIKDTGKKQRMVYGFAGLTYAFRNDYWTAGIVIDNWGEEIITGRAAICFRSLYGYKNWVAGRFEAMNCFRTVKPSNQPD